MLPAQNSPEIFWIVATAALAVVALSFLGLLVRAMGQSVLTANPALKLP
jgi:hypothetical protein